MRGLQSDIIFFVFILNLLDKLFWLGNTIISNKYEDDKY